MRDLMRDYGVYPIPAGNTGAQMGGWFRKEINGLEDLKGLQMRIPGIPGQVIARLGVVPQRSSVATSTPRSSAAQSTPPSGRVLTTTRSSAS
jgi:TRAP-type mannitol/chloroaromatic compound transport system substrate-binding protein